MNCSNDNCKHYPCNNKDCYFYKPAIHMHHIQNFLMDRYSYYHKKDPSFFHYKGVQNAFVVGTAMDLAVKDYHVHGTTKLDFKVNSKTDQAICLSTMDQYFTKYKDSQFHDYESPTITVDLDGYSIICRPDLTARTYYENEIVIIEIKTSAQEVDIKETLDFQTMCYCWAIYKSLNEIPRAVIKRTLKKPRIRKKKKETDMEYIERIVCYDKPLIFAKVRDVNLHQIQEFEKYLSEILKEMYSPNKYKFYKNVGDYWG